MQKAIIFLGLIGMLVFTTNYAYSQDVGLATFQESAQVLIEKNKTQNVTASIALQSTSIQEIRIPAELEQKIRDNGRITSVILTNQDRCVLGVNDKACIIINVARDPAEKNFLEIQNATKIIANSFIDELNQVFDTNAKFHSVFVQSSDEISKAVETSGGAASKGTVSVVYAMPMEDTESMYEKISAILLPKVIRESEGFYNVAKILSKEDKSVMTFSIIPLENKSLLQLKLSAAYKNVESTNEVSPLEFLKVDELKRSNYFSKGFYPLNSILQVAVMSPESTNVSDVHGTIVETQTVGGEKIPKELTGEGWVFDPDQGKIIQGKYIFGKRTSIAKDELVFSLGGNELLAPKTIGKFDESTIVVIIITAVAIGAAVFYLKGYRK
ncbi:MAG: hypothetical protein K8Q89_02390 [Nitrosarchaeum sp.]|nr:hypothetical protein [Nitrosarchaeum sp.]